MATRGFSAPDLTNAVEDFVGPYKLALVYRHVNVDEGPTVHVFGPVEGKEQEILRFDCFKKGPHYHLGIAYLNEPVHSIDASDPFAWVLAELGQNFPDYLARSLAACELPSDWQAVTGMAIEAFRAQAAEWNLSN
jgi:hypothetical protein